MAGLMQWFQVTCPKCTGALQVRLPEGVTSVQCSQCKAVFAVQVQPVALAPPGGPAPVVKRSRKRKKETALGVLGNAADGDPGASQAPRTLSAYNVFMKSEVAKVKTEHPALPHREAFKLAAEHWQASPMNPQNGGDRFPLKSGAPALTDVTGAPLTTASAIDDEKGEAASAHSDVGRLDGGAASSGGMEAMMANGAGDGEEDEEEDDEGDDEEVA